MGIKIKNLQTGEFEKFNIPALKGEKGEPGEIEPSEKVDYIGKQHSKLRDTMNANVDYIIKTAIGEFNYLDYEGQYITTTNSIEGHARSAILKGQTLVNLATKNTRHDGNATVTFTDTGHSIKIVFNGSGSRVVSFKLNQTLKSNTKYLFIAKCTKNFGTAPALSFFNGSSFGVDLVSTNNKDKVIITTTDASSYTHITFGLHGGMIEGNEYEVDYPVFIEYQDGMENWDIPYFEGMASCKMPVLSTVGKNLFNISTWDSFGTVGGVSSIADGRVTITPSSDDCYTSTGSTTNGSLGEAGRRFAYPCKGSALYLCSCSVSPGLSETSSHSSCYIFFFDEKYNSVGFKNFIPSGTVITAPKNAKYFTIRVGVRQGVGVSFTFSDIQVEEVESDNSTKTSYESYKSNVLCAPEEVVLRKVNGVEDTLNLNTGEYVQRTKEIVLNGSENWGLNKSLGDGSFYQFVVNMVQAKKVAQQLVVCDKLVSAPNESINNRIWIYDGTTMVIHSSCRNVDEMKTWLQQNPLTVQYELATPIVKIVDLSDNHVYSYGSTTHYSCSSEEGSLVPTLSVKVPTDTQLTIQEQKATTQTLLIKNMDLQQSIKEVQAMNLAFNTALYNSFNSIREEVEDIKKHVSTNENLEGSF